MKRALPFLASTLFLTTLSYGADPVSVTLEQGIFSYTSINTTTKITGLNDSKETQNNLTTMANSLQVWASLDDWNFYFYPTQPKSPFGVSYMLRKDFELGLQLGINSDKLDEAKSEEMSSTFGLFGIYYIPVGRATVELYVPVNFTEGVNKNPSTSTDDKLSGWSVQVGANWVQPIVKNFSWTGGLAYKIESEVTKAAAGGKRTVGTNELLVNLTTLRFYF